MFSVFPQILFLAPLGITILRITAGIYLIYVGYRFWQERKVLSQENLPIVGHMPEWLFIVGAAFHIGLGALLVIGLWTQAAALLAVIGTLKSVIFGKRYERIIPLPRSTNILLLIILLAVLVSGAGAFAFDLPL